MRAAVKPTTDPTTHAHRWSGLSSPPGYRQLRQDQADPSRRRSSVILLRIRVMVWALMVGMPMRGAHHCTQRDVVSIHQPRKDELVLFALMTFEDCVQGSAIRA